MTLCTVAATWQQPITIVAESSVMDLHAFLEDAFRSIAPDVRWLKPEQVKDPGLVDVALCWHAQPGALARYHKLKLVQSLAAGPDHLFASLEGVAAHIPLCRIVDPYMSQAMAGYVCWAVLQQQRQLRIYGAQQAQACWQRSPVEPAATHCVGIAGMGQLGMAAAQALRGLGYRVRGWSRSRKEQLPEGVQGFAGEDQLDVFLQGCDTLVCLLPLTAQTRGFIGPRVLQQLPAHAHVINVSRGEHVDEVALLDALDAGRLGFATLDVFTSEPLPSDHLFWSHPKVSVTPHVGARTANTQVVRQTLDNLQAVWLGQTRATWVDRQRGY